MKLKEIPELCKEANIDPNHVVKTYSSFLRVMHGYILRRGYTPGVDVIINRNMLKEAVVDFYNDIARIKACHHIDEPSLEKDYAYKAYWLLRRKPIQIIKEYDDCEFINEHFITSYLLATMAEKRRIDDAKKASNPIWTDFCFLLFRNMKYRAVSQQSLELMVEAFFCGCDFQ